MIWHWFCPDKKISPILFFMIVYKEAKIIPLWSLSTNLHLCVCLLFLFVILFFVQSICIFFLFVLCLFFSFCMSDFFFLFVSLFYFMYACFFIVSVFYLLSFYLFVSLSFFFLTFYLLSFFILSFYLMPFFLWSFFSFVLFLLIFHDMKKRNTEKFLVNHVNTERYMKSAIPAMQRALNKDELKLRKLLVDNLVPREHCLYEPISVKI